MDHVPDPLLLRKFGGTGNRTRDLWVSNQELWPLDDRGCQASHNLLQIWHSNIILHIMHNSFSGQVLVHFTSWQFTVCANLRVSFLTWDCRSVQNSLPEKLILVLCCVGSGIWCKGFVEKKYSTCEECNTGHLKSWSPLEWKVTIQSEASCMFFMCLVAILQSKKSLEGSHCEKYYIIKQKRKLLDFYILNQRKPLWFIYFEANRIISICGTWNSATISLLPCSHMTCTTRLPVRIEQYRANNKKLTFAEFQMF
jgi:hypothetical protein